MSGTLSLVVAMQLARVCAGSIAPETLLSVVKAESGFNALAIGDNTDRRSYTPPTLADAVAITSPARHPGATGCGTAANWSRRQHHRGQGIPAAAG